MTKAHEKLLQRLCIRGVISTKRYWNDYWKRNLPKARSLQIQDGCLRRLSVLGIISPATYWEMRRRKLANRRKAWTEKKFDLGHYTEKKSLKNFRFTPEEIRKLYMALQIPERVRLVNRRVIPGLEAFCIMLRRLCYPNRLSDLCDIFHRDEWTLSRTANIMVRYLYHNHRHRLTTIAKPWLTRDKYYEYADAIGQAGSPMPNIVGFIDGTCREICRPIYRQEEFYSGYKKIHCIKYQSVVMPDGIIARLDGPFVGRRHDAAVVHLSGIRGEFQQQFPNPDGTWMSVYGDPGYSNGRFIKAGYRNHQRLNRIQKEFNRDMSSLRVSVEYGFGRIVQQFAFLDFAKNQKIFQQPLQEQYYVAALLVNCQSCLRGNQTSIFFDIAPPSIETYLR